ncbi:MAG: hypothetical protein Ct9H90mP20_5320 [Candidatus Neomarinimicrobiota bacterium]|nr:MAG: hypothetical protein Ct9H90mP20_5320 [Candidatus Neomarinimicrobiota bacterium]
MIKDLELPDLGEGIDGAEIRKFLFLWVMK